MNDVSPTLTSTSYKEPDMILEIWNENETRKESVTIPNQPKNYETKPFRYASLFAGVGGFETALNRLGGECVFASEIDKFAQQAYGVLYDGDVLHGDITKVDAKDVPDCDVLVGGFPCQAFSVAGKRGGFDDARGTLFFEVARILAEKRPRVVLLENVKGLVGHDAGTTLNTIVTALNECGYTVDFEVLNSKYFGVPQNRERIFIVGVLGGEQAEWHEVSDKTRKDVVAKGKRRIAQLDGVRTFNFDWPTQDEVTTRLRDVLEDNVGERYYLSEEKTAKLVAQLRADNEPLNSDQCRATLTPDRENKRQNGRRFKDNDEPAFTLNTQDRHAEIATGSNLSYCIDANYTKGISPKSVNKGRRTHVQETSPRYRIRKLTPLECFRLQGFTDEQHAALEAAGISNSQRYKLAGNAVTVNVIEAIGAKLAKLLRD